MGTLHKWINNTTGIVDKLAVLKVFGVESCTAAFKCSGNDQAVVEREFVLLGNRAGIPDGAFGVGVNDVILFTFLNDIQNINVRSLEFFMENVCEFLKYLGTDMRGVMFNQLLGDLTFARFSFRVGVNKDIGVNKNTIAHWLGSGRR